MTEKYILPNLVDLQGDYSDAQRILKIRAPWVDIVNTGIIKVFIVILNRLNIMLAVLHRCMFLAAVIIFMGGWDVLADPLVYPELRDSHDPDLQRALDEHFKSDTLFMDGVHKKELSIILVDVTDLHRPKVAGYNPNLMLYAASLPKIAIALGIMVEVDRGRFDLDAKTHAQLVRMIRHSSNQDATTLLHRVGFERLADILQDERYGKLYDPSHGGGLWVGKAYGKSSAWRRDPLKGISHGASAMQVARFYYGIMTGTIIDIKYLPVFEEIFGNPAINHKFVKGLKGKKDTEIYRKSGSWRDYHADSAVIVHENVVYIIAYIDKHPEAGQGAVTGIQIIDEMMLKRSQEIEKPSTEGVE